MHLFENFFPLTLDLDAYFSSERLQIGGQLMEILRNASGVHYHHHIEIPLDDGLCDVQNVYVLFCQVCAYPGNDADSILADHGDYAPVHFCGYYRGKNRKIKRIGISKRNANFDKIDRKQTDKMEKFLFLGNIGVWEIVLIALVVLLFFGGRKIPELMKGLGKGVKSFKEGMTEVEKELNTPVSGTKSETSSGKAETEPAKSEETDRK